MTSDTNASLEDLIRNGVVRLDVTDAPWGEEVTVEYDDDSDSKYGISREQHEQISSLIDKYEDLVIELNSIKTEYDGLERAWELGRLVDEHVENGDLTNGQFSMLAHVGSSGEGTYVGQFHEIYEAFPDKCFSEEHFTTSYLAELMHTVDHETARRINEQAIEHDIRMRKQELRAIRDAYGADTAEDAVTNATERTAFNDYTDSELAAILHNAFQLLGRTASKDEIEDRVGERR